MTLAARLIREHKVATVPGTAFGLADGTYLRISYGALAGERIDEGMGRLVRGIQAIVAAK
jgi:aspartate/methionine/tyrosine aminotransferase